MRTNEKREAQISQNLLTTIKKYLKNNKTPSKYLFSTRQSSNITQKRVQQILGQYQIKGIKITPQIIRYTHIAHAYQKGVAIQDITKQVGLRRSRTIEIFSQLETTGSSYDNFLKFGLIKNV